MIKLNQCASIASAVLDALEKYPVDMRPARWGGKANAVIKFKEEVMTQGMQIQGRKCAWCTLSLDEHGRRTAHRDHIAPKARYPQWTFHAKNLIIACEYCNGFAVKGEINTIQTVDDDYDSCVFLVVHPYLDDPAEHLEFVCDDRDFAVVIRSDTPKGIWTIANLHLDTPGATVERAKDRLMEQYLRDLSPGNQALIKAASAALG